MLTQKHGSIRKNGGSFQPLPSPSNGSSMEIEARERAFTPTSDSRYNPTTSTKLLKILNRIWSLEEQHSSSLSLVSALRSELEHARVRVQELMQEQKVDRQQIDSLMKRIAEEKSSHRFCHSRSFALKSCEQYLFTTQSIFTVVSSRAGGEVFQFCVVS